MMARATKTISCLKKTILCILLLLLRITAYAFITCLRNVIGFCPHAWQSPMLARITCVNGFFTPCIIHRSAQLYISTTENLCTKSNELVTYLCAVTESPDTSCFGLSWDITFHVCTLAQSHDCVHFFTCVQYCC